MAGYLICVDKESGVPIFARKLGEVEHIEFPVAASLNGLRVYGKAQGIQLISTLTGNSRFLWKDYQNSISLIFGGTDDTVSELHLNRMLDNVFYTMALFVGMKNLQKPINLDKLKRAVRIAYPTIDKILHGLRPTELTMYFSDLTACIDVSFQSLNSSKSQSILQSFVQNLDVVHAAMYSIGIILATSPHWNDISLTDRILIGLATQTAVFTDTNLSESVVYLPKTSPEVPLRLVVISCSANIRITILCGRKPDLDTIQKESSRILESPSEANTFKNQLSMESLSATRKSFNAHRYTEGFLIRNMHDRVCAFAIFPSSRTIQKLEALRTFFRNVVPDCLPWTTGGRVTSTMSVENVTATSTVNAAAGPASATATANEEDVEGNNRTKETFWSSDYWKCHGIQFGPYQLFVVYEAEISQPILRNATWSLFKNVLKDKAIK